MDLKNCIGIGVAGNFSGHLADAQEAGNFTGVQTQHLEAPKGIFPFYLPHCTHPLGCYPYSHDTIILPQQAADLQAEPELALLCTLTYQGKQVRRIEATHFAAFNDCSIRSAGGKISTKKNWGPCCRGIAKHFIALDRFAPGGMLDRYQLASFVRRQGVYYPYGVDSAVSSYSYFYEQLTEWLVDRMNHQVDEGPLEDFPALLTSAQYPSQALICVGSTRYETFGKNEFLQAGDTLDIVLYDRTVMPGEKVCELLDANTELPALFSVLRQKVISLN